MIKSVSLCMVVYNEAHRIFDTLNSVAAHVDEIVIVDQQSTDHTVGVVWDWHSSYAKNPPTKVLSDIHWGYCEPSRKLAQHHADGDWILTLDADESISSDFAREMRTVDEKGYLGTRLKRSLWIAGEHRFTGDYQYRYYFRGSVRYLDEIHTEPQPTIHQSQIYSPEYVGIWHQKSWAEQIRDEEAYEDIIGDSQGIEAQRKRELNVHLALLRERGLTAEQVDAMTLEERAELGLGSSIEFNG